MSHYTMSYKGLAPKEADAKAIADTKDYRGAKAWEVLLYEMGRAEGHAKQANDNPAIGSAICQDMNRALWICDQNELAPLTHHWCRNKRVMESWEIL